MDKMETSGSSLSSDNDDNELESRAEELEKQVADNKYLYDVHVELVNIYRQLSDLKSLRAAFERFQTLYPLTSELWLTWLRIEMELASTPGEKTSVLKLFEKAVEDYLSISLWLEYAQFSMGILETDEVRALINKGLTVGGLHTSQGSLLWDVLREYEITHLSMTEQGSEEWQKQLNRVQEVFRRQLSVPLLDMKGTYNEWKVWVEQLPEGHGIDTKQVEWAYQNALKKLDKYKPFEDRLLECSDENESFNCYREYIKTCNDPSTSLCLYERAVAELSLNIQLWVEYCYFSMKLGDICNKVVKRALRNCPWAEELWICSMRILEDQKKNQKEITECLEQGLSSISPSPGLNLWLTYLEYMRRNSESTEHLHKLFSQAIEQLGEGNDPSFILGRWEARLYAKEGNFDSARRIWADILRSSNFRKSASVWLEYAALERQSNQPQQLRSLFQKAISIQLDWPQYIVDEWMLFEREHGSLHDVIRCEKLCQEAIKKHAINNNVNQDIAKEQEINEKTRERREKRKRPGDNERGDDFSKKMKKIEQKPPKRKLNPSDFDTEKSVFLSNMRSDVTEEKLQEIFPKALKILIPTDRKGNSRCYAYVEFADKEEAEKTLERDREPLDERPLFVSKCKPHSAGATTEKSFKYSERTEKNKLFVRGLPYSYSQKDVEDIFKPHGAVAVRLVTMKSGKSKGLAYVEFPDVNSAEKAMKATDQLSLGEFSISVAISAPPPKRGASEESTTGFRNARTRLTVPLVPRVVQSKINVSNESKKDTSTQKSNEDFRKMLLK